MPGEDKTHRQNKKSIIEISKRVMKIFHFCLIYGAVLLYNLCLYLYFSQNQTLSPFLEKFLTLWPFYLRDNASHLWRLHLLWRVELKNNNRVYAWYM